MTADPVKNPGRTDAELDRGSGDGLARANERDSSTSELDREWSWHE